MGTSTTVQAAVYAYEGASNPYSLSFAVKGTSGYSFGHTQGDTANNAAALQTFTNILNDPTTQAAAGLSQSQANQIVQAASVTGSSSVIQQYQSQINTALSSTYGQQQVDAYDSSRISQITTQVQGLLDAAQNNPNGAGVLSSASTDPTAVAELAQYANQFGGTSTLQSYLSGNQVSLNGNTLQTNGAISLDQMNSYFGDTKFFSQNPNNYQRFLDTAQTVGQQQGAPSPGPTPPAPSVPEPPAPSPSPTPPAPTPPAPTPPAPTPPAPTPPAPTPPAPTPPAPTPPAPAPTPPAPAPTPPAPAPAPAPTSPAPTAPAPTGPIGSGSGSAAGVANRAHPRVGRTKVEAKGKAGTAADPSRAHLVKTGTVSHTQQSVRHAPLAKLIADAEHTLRTGQKNGLKAETSGHTGQKRAGETNPTARASGGSPSDQARHAASLLKQAMISFAPAGAVETGTAHAQDHRQATIAKPPAAGGHHT